MDLGQNTRQLFRLQSGVVFNHDFVLTLRLVAAHDPSASGVSVADEGWSVSRRQCVFKFFCDSLYWVYLTILIYGKGSYLALQRLLFFYYCHNIIIKKWIFILMPGTRLLRNWLNRRWCQRLLLRGAIFSRALIRRSIQLECLKRLPHRWDLLVEIDSFGHV